MTIQSNPLLIHCGIEKVSSYLSIPSNLSSLLPKDRISEFQSDDQGCAFKVQGGITISLVFSERNEQGIRYMSGLRPSSINFILLKRPKSLFS
ncbi:MAG: hypothetical protein EBS17_06545 [Flavobacteriia bacterium]|nr:hypothetical protein [Flavobacteriia bacterium]